MEAVTALDTLLDRRRTLVLRVAALEMDANDPRFRHDHDRRQRLRDEINVIHRELRDIKQTLRTTYRSF